MKTKYIMNTTIPTVQDTDPVTGSRVVIWAVDNTEILCRFPCKVQRN